MPLRSRLLVAGVGAVLLSSGCGGGGEPASTAGANGRPLSAGGEGPAEEAPEPVQGRMGQTVRGKELAYTVREQECGVRKIRVGVALGYTADGQYCIYTLDVEVLSKVPLEFQPHAQRAYTTDGSQYNGKRLSGREVEPPEDDLSPGQRTTGQLVFELPADRRIVRLELRPGNPMLAADRARGPEAVITVG
ncbi:DUF4352 domain-containing protein [Actinomadura madurae]|uniref:DUF4352 domain-containing protein n=1 Tax=Actinomadura madurae TaxID=1993 RepID=A0A1I5TVT7_9ACTN|nr:DUF4352 domain-containing protein [Actinomadura madurae]SFP87164.1 protein of unknown function [Actinomadura madurae]SPT51578.1 Uncharacterised protein [Actinomadura madurae]